jgi:hypothetical protein
MPALEASRPTSSSIVCPVPNQPFDWLLAQI